AAACGARQDPDPAMDHPGGSRPDAGPVEHPDASPPPQTTPAIDGFALDVQAGDWWQFRYEETWNSRTTQSSVYRFILDGPPRSANGLSIFRLRVEGTAETPPWTYLGFGAHGIFGSEDGVKFEPIFDAWNGAWPGATGLWGHGNGGPVHVGPASRDGHP